MDLLYIFGLLLSMLSFINHMRQSLLLFEKSFCLAPHQNASSFARMGNPICPRDQCYDHRLPTTRPDTGQSWPSTQCHFPTAHQWQCDYHDKPAEFLWM